jgi:hypothetical protein
MIPLVISASDGAGLLAHNITVFVTEKSLHKTATPSSTALAAVNLGVPGPVD